MCRLGTGDWNRIGKYLGVMTNGDGRIEEEIRSGIRKAARVI